MLCFCDDTGLISDAMVHRTGTEINYALAV